MNELTSVAVCRTTEGGRSRADAANYRHKSDTFHDKSRSGTVYLTESVHSAVIPGLVTRPLLATGRQCVSVSDRVIAVF